MTDVVWGYCLYCNKEIEIRDGRMLAHLESYEGPNCRGSRMPPFGAQAQEGAWQPVRRPHVPAPPPAAAVRYWRDYFRKG